jgi:hypothetical protein
MVLGKKKKSTIACKKWTTRVDGNQKVIMHMMRLSLKQFNRHSRSQTST